LGPISHETPAWCSFQPIVTVPVGHLCQHAGIDIARKIIIPRCVTAAQRKAFFLLPEPPPWCVQLEKWPYHTPEWKQWITDTRAGKNPPLPCDP
jgi:hypothetical protein